MLAVSQEVLIVILEFGIVNFWLGAQALLPCARLIGPYFQTSKGGSSLGLLLGFGSGKLLPTGQLHLCSCGVGSSQAFHIHFGVCSGICTCHELVNFFLFVDVITSALLVAEGCSALIFIIVVIFLCRDIYKALLIALELLEFFIFCGRHLHFGWLGMIFHLLCSQLLLKFCNPFAKDRFLWFWSPSVEIVLARAFLKARAT